jgi:hypothetical protein
MGLTPGRTHLALEASQRVGIRRDGLAEDLDCPALSEEARTLFG